jgi:hypothetical protein
MEKYINPNFKIVWAEMQAHPAAQPPFCLRIGIQSTQESGLIVLADTLIFTCTSIEDAIRKFDVFVEKSQFALADTFALVYPMYPIDKQLEPSLHYIASLVMEQAQQKKWNYERALPTPIWWE